MGNKHMTRLSSTNEKRNAAQNHSEILPRTSHPLEGHCPKNRKGTGLGEDVEKLPLLNVVIGFM